MATKFTILDTESGVLAVHVDSHPYEDNDFWYLCGDGNYGCDCNRALHWCRALGIDELDVPCNGIGPQRFQVVRVETDNGKVYKGDAVAELNEDVPLIVTG